MDNDLTRIHDYRHQIVERLKSFGYHWVTLDLEEYRSGNMNKELNPEELMWKTKNIVAISGGVDSSVAAFLLKTRVSSLWDYHGFSGNSRFCERSTFRISLTDAKRVCEILEIPHQTLELSNEFENEVVKPLSRNTYQEELPTRA